MAEYMKKYRDTHPEYYRLEKIKINEKIKERYETDTDFKQRVIDRNKNLYHSNPEFRQKIIDASKDRNRRIKEQKNMIQVS